MNVERAYLNYKFHPALQLNTGLMGGGQWASTFGDTEINVTRVQFIGALSADMVFIATYEKQDEKGTIANVSSDKDDTTVYYLASRMKFGPLTVLPLVAYGTKGWGYQGGLETAFAGLNAAGFSKKKYDQTVMSGTLGLNGDFGMIGFESEFQYKVIDSDGLDDDATKNSAAFTGAVGAGTTAALQALDSTTYGAYVNLFAKVDPAKVGFVFAYASADEKDGVYNWGEDFDVCVVMDDYIAQGSANLMGWSVYKLYADVTMGAIGVNAAVAYGATNKDYVATADLCND
ncbi:MAG: hypothetical protein CVV49_21175 [Spirochaetae bacterium HGW-Spirochaetae-5]|nr:MAG: hypothetical protein CVV49_21175 [Spirochaetae bacterium HGW-Spirochaetae-5]